MPYHPAPRTLHPTGPQRAALARLHTAHTARSGRMPSRHAARPLGLPGMVRGQHKRNAARLAPGQYVALLGYSVAGRRPTGAGWPR